MPPVRHPSSAALTAKPYAGAVKADPASQQAEAPTCATPSSKNSHGRQWTGAEYVRLHAHVVAHGCKPKDLHNAVPGRTANQCYLAFRDVVRPACEAALLAKGNDKKGRKYELRPGAKSSEGHIPALDIIHFLIHTTALELVPAPLAMPPTRQRSPSPETKPYTASASPSHSGGTKWTAAEYLQLFDHVVHHGPGKKGLKDAVPGRSANQCYKAWTWVPGWIWLTIRQTVGPICRTALAAAKGGDRK
ncbi:hypothetical protein Q8F55_006519 [Vanrija albida]|uniref:Myb-like domain-containing protein n=1 Tax=Vanrija albida TaxID=181172 RepID=A0ABR3PXJ0_9TREE